MSLRLCYLALFLPSPSSRWPPLPRLTSGRLTRSEMPTRLNRRVFSPKSAPQTRTNGQFKSSLSYQECRFRTLRLVHSLTIPSGRRTENLPRSQLTRSHSSQSIRSPSRVPLRSIGLVRSASTRPESDALS